MHSFCSSLCNYFAVIHAVIFHLFYAFIFLMLQVIMMLAIDGILAVVTWAPYFLWVIIDSHTYSGDIIPIARSQKKVMVILFALASIVNSVITPIIYLITNNHYKVRHQSFILCARIKLWSNFYEKFS